jgi:iron complex outermembrane receptor protein
MEMTASGPARRLEVPLLSTVLLAACGSLLASGRAHADGEVPSNPSEVKAIEELSLDALLNAKIVTASGSEEARSRAPANVYAIDREQMLRYGWRSVADALEHVPGLYLTDDLVSPSVAVRGTSGGLRAGTRIIKVMIDGHPVSFHPDLNAAVGPEYIPLEAVERIEVAKGPLSALYGANAFLATVNVITVRPGPGVHGEIAGRGHWQGAHPGVGASTAVESGGQVFSVLAAATFDWIDRSGLHLQRTFDGQRLPDTLYDEPSTNDRARPLSGFVRLDARDSRAGTFSLAGGVQQTHAAGEFQLNSLLTHQSHTEITNLWSHASYDRSWVNGLRASLSLGLARGEPTGGVSQYLTGNQAYTFAPRFGYRSVTFGGEVGYTPGTRLGLKLGVDLEQARENVLYYTKTFNQAEGIRQPGDSIDLVPDMAPRGETLSSQGAYLQAIASPLAALPDLRAVGNFRLDRISPGDVRFPLQVSWRGALIYPWSAAFTTKLIAGRAFQAPSGVLLFGHPGFGNANNVIGSHNVPGTPPLRPQTAESIEAAGSLYITENVAGEFSFYAQVITDKIEFVQEGTDLVAANRGRTISAGGEMILHLSLGPVHSELNGHLNAPVQDGRPRFDAVAQYPLVAAALLTAVDLRLLRSAVQVRWTSARASSQSNAYLNNGRGYTLAPYLRVDLTLTSPPLRPFGRQGGGLTATLALRNLLGERHSEPFFAGFDLPAPGRVGFFELRLAF